MDWHAIQPMGNMREVRQSKTHDNFARPGMTVYITEHKKSMINHDNAWWVMAFPVHRDSINRLLLRATLSLTVIKTIISWSLSHFNETIYPLKVTDKTQRVLFFNHGTKSNLGLTRDAPDKSYLEFGISRCVKDRSCVYVFLAISLTF